MFEAKIKIDSDIKITESFDSRPAAIEFVNRVLNAVVSKKITVSIIKKGRR